MEILKALDDKVLRKNIDLPIYQAVAEYKQAELSAVNHLGFMELIVSLVSHLNANASGFREHLPPVDAYAKGVEFLDSHYCQRPLIGSEVALLDFTNAKPNAVETIIDSIRAGFIREQRIRFTEQVLSSHVPSEWNARRHLVQTLFELFKDDLPLTDLPPGQFSGSIEKLIITLAQAQATMRGTLGKFSP